MDKSVWVGDRRQTSLPDQSDGFLWQNDWLHGQRAADVIHPDFRGHSICIWKLGKYGLEELTVRWVENWLDSWVWRIVIHGSMPSWQLVTSGEPHALILGPILSSIFRMNLVMTQWTLSKFSNDTKLEGHELQTRDTMRNLRTGPTGAPESSARRSKKLYSRGGITPHICLARGGRLQSAAAERGLGLCWMAT